MNYFTKKRLVFWSVTLLIIMNISSLATVWWQQHRRPGPMPADHPPSQRASQFLKHELGLSETQVEQFEAMQRRHFDKARALNDSMRQLKHQLFNELSAEAPDTSKAAIIADQIGKKQTQLDKLTFNHLLDLKNMCTPSQQKKLNIIFEDLLRRMAPPRPDGPPIPHRQ